VLNPVFEMFLCGLKAMVPSVERITRPSVAADQTAASTILWIMTTPWSKLTAGAVDGVISMTTQARYWFRAKRYGWGWGLPCSWQGWLFFLAWLCALGLAAMGLMPARPFVFAMTLAILTVILVAVCYIKGEPLPGGFRKTR
jgi:hypothetical protein